MAVSWNMAPCSLIESDRRFRDVYHHRHQGDGSSQKALIFNIIIFKAKNLKARYTKRLAITDRLVLLFSNFVHKDRKINFIAVSCRKHFRFMPELHRRTTSSCPVLPSTMHSWFSDVPVPR
jgi:hypothetical protein